MLCVWVQERWNKCISFTGHHLVVWVVAVELVTSKKFSYIEPDRHCDWWPLAGVPSWYSFRPLSLAILPGQALWLLAISQSLLGKKPQVLRSSELCYQDFWHTGLLYSSLIGSNPRHLKSQRGWASSQRTLRSMHKSSCSVIRSY